MSLRQCSWWHVPMQLLLLLCVCVSMWLWLLTCLLAELQCSCKQTRLGDPCTTLPAVPLC